MVSREDHAFAGGLAEVMLWVAASRATRRVTPGRGAQGPLATGSSPDPAAAHPGLRGRFSFQALQDRFQEVGPLDVVGDERGHQPAPESEGSERHIGNWRNIERRLAIGCSSPGSSRRWLVVSLK